MFRSHLSLRLLPVVLLALLAGACTVESELPSDDGVEGSTGEASEAITVDEVLARAKQWIDAKVPYCGGVRNGPDAICGGTCSRPAAAWDAYRTDCSGFVSWSWGLPAPGWTTSTFMTKLGSTVKQLNVDQLSAGDAVVTTSKGHVVLFRKWVTPSKRMEIWEESTCGGVAHSREVNITVNSATRLHLSGDSREYTPVRYTGVTGCTPSAEVCNGKDDNCNGQVDEGNVCNAPPQGFLDSAGCEDIGGWAQDTNAPTASIDVHVYFDGPAGKGTGFPTKADIARSDLCTAIGSCNHGFHMLSPLSLHNGAAHEVHAYGIDTAGGTNAELAQSPQSLKCPATLPNGVRRAISSGAMSAWKFDAFWQQLPAAAASVDALPEGKALGDKPILVQAKGKAEVWLIDGTYRRHVPSMAVLDAWKFAAGSVQSVTDQELAKHEQGTNVRARPVLAAGSSKVVYLIDDKQKETTEPDAGVDDSGAVETDAGPVDTDAGEVETDAGADAAALDASASKDGTAAKTDGGSSMIDSTSDGSGCSVSTGRSSAGFALGLLAACGLLASRRRRR